MCSAATAPGDTVRARLIGGGAQMTSPEDSVSLSLFVVHEFRIASLRDTSSKPALDIELVTVGGRAPERSLRPHRVAMELRLRTDSVQDQLYRCILPGLPVYVGAHSFIRRPESAPEVPMLQTLRPAYCDLADLSCGRRAAEPSFIGHRSDGWCSAHLGCDSAYCSADARGHSSPAGYGAPERSSRFGRRSNAIQVGGTMTLSIELEQEADGRWLADATALPGVLAYGVTVTDAVAKVQALALRVLADRLEQGEAVPEFLTVTFLAV